MATFLEDSKNASLYFWAIGDLHYRAIPAWHELHTRRLSFMFNDLHTLWEQGGQPVFCVSPGDLVETCTLENYHLARTTLTAQLGTIPFYVGIGNHEYYDPNGTDPSQMAARFCSIWEKPLRYSWQANDVTCIMLDYPDPSTLDDPTRISISAETLTFLDTTLSNCADQTAIIFLHCPLRNTVLDRDVERHLDYNSLQHFFSPENSQEVRDILARHRHASLYFSGHTHSGWEAPNLVITEQLGNHPVTFVNLMSPWYTGTHHGGRLSPDFQSCMYKADEPDVITSFSIHIFTKHATIRVREHRTQQWLKTWTVPLE